MRRRTISKARAEANREVRKHLPSICPHCGTLLTPYGEPLVVKTKPAEPKRPKGGKK